VPDRKGHYCHSAIESLITAVLYQNLNCHGCRYAEVFGDRITISCLAFVLTVVCSYNLFAAVALTNNWTDQLLYQRVGEWCAHKNHLRVHRS
jgi:hypothetical protein